MRIFQFVLENAICFCARCAHSGFTLLLPSVLIMYRDTHGGRLMPGERSFLFGHRREGEISRFDLSALSRLTLLPPRVVILRRYLQSDGDATGELAHVRKCLRAHLLNLSLFSCFRLPSPRQSASDTTSVFPVTNELHVCARGCLQLARRAL